MRPNFTINFEWGFDDYYIINLDVKLDKLTLQKEEVKDVKFASLSDVKNLIKQGDFIPYTFEFVDFCFNNYQMKGKIYK